MPRQKVTWGIDVSIADPSSPDYNPDDPDFGIAELMRNRQQKMLGLASQNVSVDEGDTVQIWDIPNSILCFLNCSGDLDEITIVTQSAENVSDAQQLAIYTTHNIGSIIWQGIPIQNAPTMLAESDYYSFRFRAAGDHFIKTVSP